jgi:AcrR family transcriptional regulator
MNAAPTGTKLQIAEAALLTLREHGYAGASARTIAAAGGFNQALIFYHYGSVRNALLAALDLVSERRMAAYGDALRDAAGAAELVRLARRIRAEDLENGYITVLGEMVSGGVSDAELGREVAAHIEPWIELAQQKVESLLAGSPLLALVAPRDLAFGLVSLYFGVDMLSHLQRDPARAEALLDLGARLAALADVALPRPPEAP